MNQEKEVKDFDDFNEVKVLPSGKKSQKKGIYVYIYVYVCV
jgi:hypothetical protein